MATFRLTTPDGAVYSVDAPDENAALSALGSMYGGGQDAPASPELNAPDAMGFAPRSVREAGTEPNELRATRDELVRANYDKLPWYLKAAQAAQDVGQLAAQGATFGFGDRIAAGLNSLTQGTPYDQALAAERERTGDARARAGSASIPAEIVGGAASGIGLARAGLTATGAVASRGLGAKGIAAGSAADGAAIGAIHGAGQGDTLEESLDKAKTGALTGAAIGGATPGVASGLAKIAGAFKAKPDVPTTQALWDKAEQAYAAADKAGVIIRPEAISRLKANLEKALADFGWSPEITPGVSGVLKNIDRMGGENVTLKGLDTLRKTAGQLRARDQGETSRAIGGKLTQEIDAFMSGVKPADIVQGDAAAGVKSLMQAREMWKRASKADKVETAMQEAADRAAKTGSGGNINNATRQEIDKVAKRGNWTPDEQAALDAVVKQGGMADALRLAGKLSPEGNGLSLLLQLGAAGATSGASLPLAAAGGVAKRIADRNTLQKAQEALRIIQAGGNRSNAIAPPNMLEALITSNPARLGTIGGLVPVSPEPRPFWR